jgi:serine/threonine protein kinase/formylglycine-generating enzyme required for sulfatase activity
MSETTRPTAGPADTKQVDEPAERLWNLWRQGQRPDLHEFLATTGAMSTTQLVALLRVDQQERWRIGQRPPASGYLRDHPAVRNDPEAAHELIYGEFLLREELGETPTLEDYLVEYPEHASRLRMQVDLHRALSPSAVTKATGLTSVLGSGVVTDPEYRRLSERSSVREGTWRPRSVPPPLPGTGLSHTRFRPLRIHARGGLGQVSIAIDEELRREVALKEIVERHADDPTCRARFVHEAEVTGGLEHPGIVAVYGLGYHPDGRPYYAMRLIRGESLREAIDKLDKDTAPGSDSRRSTGLRRLLGRFVDACDAIAYAHSRGVLHRDIKPDNIMLGPFGETLVVDWGMAKVVGRDAPPPRPEEGPRPSDPERGEAPTLPGSAVGTPAYMSPEQAAGRLDQLGPASDVYNLGATLYHILTGRPPLADGSPVDILAKVRSGDIPPPRSVFPKVPRSLEAVCRKAMALRPEDRYASARALAEDVERWLADEPVSACREPWPTRARRWASRHRPLVAATTATLLVASLATAAYLAQRLANAHRRVDALATAETRALPAIVKELGADRWLVRDRLSRMFRSDGESAVRLPAALALLPDDPAQVEFLARLAIDPQASPDQVRIIRDALIEHRRADRAAKSWRLALPAEAEDLTDSQLRAAGALAGASPADPVIAALADPIARKLSQENPLHLNAWREVFQPLADRLIEPLRRIYGDPDAAGPRRHAFTLLFEFATRPDNKELPEDLAALVADSDPEQFRRVVDRLDAQANRDRAVAFLAPLVKDPARFDEGLARRQARVALALLRLGAAGAVWPLFRHREDPSARTELIHNLSRYEFDPGAVVDRLEVESDASSRRALILCLGEFEAEKVSESARKSLTARLLDRYRDDPDPGVHESIRWLLRERWGWGDELAPVDREAAGGSPMPGRDWYVNGQGQTFAIVRGPVEFSMGSSVRSDPDRDPDEIPHRRRIDRSFAIATREVSFAEYRRFLDEKPEGVTDRRSHPQTLQDIPTPDCAAGVVTWYDAARYCNWLSAMEGIPEDQWCFPKTIEPGSRLPEDYLSRTGYRLPTEAEWEYVCRAGSTSSYPFGSSKTWLPEYGWFDSNSGRRMHPVGRKKPNDLGIFDLLGNAYEWCADFHGAYAPSEGGEATLDALADVPISDEGDRCLRGGAFISPASHLRSALRNGDTPTLTLTFIGIRLARTITTTDHH